MILSLLVLAAFAGGLVDAIAGGGGLFTLPALLAAGLPPGLAIATNKGQAAPGALASFVTFFRRGGVDRERAPLGFAAGFAGSLLGARLLLWMRPEPLRPLVAALLVLSLAGLLVRGRARPRQRAPEHPRLTLGLVAFGLGAYDGFFGPGVGSLLIVAFVTLFGDTPLRASGNAKVVNLASNLAAFMLFSASSRIVWRLALPMAAANVLGARLGARVALRRGDGFVRGVVVLVVVLVVVKLVADMIMRRP